MTSGTTKASWFAQGRLILEAPTPQNGQARSKDSLATPDKLFECVGPYCRVGT